MDKLDALIEEIVAQIKEQMKIIDGIENAIAGLEEDKDKRYVKIAHLKQDLNSIKRTKEMLEKNGGK